MTKGGPVDTNSTGTIVDTNLNGTIVGRTLPGEIILTHKGHCPGPGNSNFLHARDITEGVRQS